MKLFCLALGNISRKSTADPGRAQNWKVALNRVTILFEDRMTWH
jgi:hypothetical protein